MECLVIAGKIVAGVVLFPVAYALMCVIPAMSNHPNQAVCFWKASPPAVTMKATESKTPEVSKTPGYTERYKKMLDVAKEKSSETP